MISYKIISNSVDLLKCQHCSICNALVCMHVCTCACVHVFVDVHSFANRYATCTRANSCGRLWPKDTFALRRPVCWLTRYYLSRPARSSHIARYRTRRLFRRNLAEWSAVSDGVRRRSAGRWRRGSTYRRKQRQPPARDSNCQFIRNINPKDTTSYRGWRNRSSQWRFKDKPRPTYRVARFRKTDLYGVASIIISIFRR